ncbi:MAG: CdaR family protein [Chloroflexi bacterium]|nr:CdaR family protein [Chloroflexota bacterium]
MLGRFGENLRTFIWAFVLALAVWVAAVTAADPDEVRVYPNPIKIQIVGQDPGLVVRGDIPQETQVTLRAPRSVWDELTAQPNSVRAVLDLSGLDAGQHQANLQIQVSLRPVQIVSANPSSAAFTLEPLITRMFPIALNLTGQLPIGYQAGTSTIDPTEVTISGPQSLVSQVTQTSVSLTLNEVRGSIDRMLAINALNKNNQVVSGLTLHPDTAHVTVPVNQEGGFRDVAVKVIVRGQVASGYRLDNISVSPPVITVYSSDSALVNAMPGYVETQPIDLQGASDNLNARVPLNLPDGISVVGQPTVQIQAAVSAIQSSLTMSGETVEVIGVAQGMQAQVSPATVDVILSGPLPVLDTLTRQDVRVSVDVTGYDAGSYQLTPKVEVLAAGVIVESILPGTVGVVIAPMPTATPQP